MRNFKAKKLLIVAGMAFLSIIALHTSFKQMKHNPVYFAPPETIKHFSFGFQDLYADLLWVRLLQDVDFCNTESGLPIYDGKTSYQCEKGWSYRLADAITELAPRFQQVYLTAGSILSIVMGDREGATHIYDKGLKIFPKDWRLNYSAAYHYLFELKNKKRATELLNAAAQNGGPLWLYLLVVKNYESFNEYEFAKQTLKIFLKKHEGSAYESIIKQKLKELEQKI